MMRYATDFERSPEHSIGAVDDQKNVDQVSFKPAAKQWRSH